MNSPLLKDVMKYLFLILPFVCALTTQPLLGAEKNTSKKAKTSKTSTTKKSVTKKKTDTKKSAKSKTSKPTKKSTNKKAPSTKNKTAAAPSPALVAKAQKMAASLPKSKSSKLLKTLNSGSVTDLQTLPGIGETRAHAIKKGRPYRKLEELVNVNGLGEKTFSGLIKHAKAN